jgi:alkaline phosphatase D
MHHSFQHIANRIFSSLIFALFALCPFAVACQAQAIAPVITVDHGPNAPQQLSKPYVILVSLDGFRYDYAKRYHAEHLLALAAEGASAPEGMLPSYPSITFPNHYTIVTGLYPEHHGIVANSFYDPARKETYNYHDGKSVGDGTWYGGTPLWVLAEQQGMRSASFFWVGSEADIQGVRPTYYLKFDASFPNHKRVEQVLAWLHLPPEQRPHMITLYFSDTDTAGHRYGPDSPQVADAVHELDGEIGKLVDGIKQSKLAVDLIVLADHGMAEVKGAPIHLDQYGLNPAYFAPIVGLGLMRNRMKMRRRRTKRCAEKATSLRSIDGRRCPLICTLKAALARAIPWWCRTGLISSPRAQISTAQNILLWVRMDTMPRECPR